MLNMYKKFDTYQFIKRVRILQCIRPSLTDLLSLDFNLEILGPKFCNKHQIVGKSFSEGCRVV